LQIPSQRDGEGWNRHQQICFAPLLQRLLKTPGAVDSVDYSITISDLKHRWEWDPIRSDPHFQKLLEQPAK